MASLLSKITNGFINKQFDIVKCINSLPSDTTEINVSGLGLTVLPDLSRFKQLTHLYCSRNKLTLLPSLNSSLKYLDCSYNKLTRLPQFNSKLKRLDCEHNLLTDLPYLNNITVLNCSDNPMPHLPALNTKLTHINCDLLCCSTIFSDKINILMNFRFTFYCLKFKNKFKRWLWEKVREPKVMAKFHPNHLTNLEETDDLEVFLDDWIKC
jgi:Leucine-rich repeat (LRR) protein